MSKDKAKNVPTCCSTCHQELRVPCPSCRRTVRIVDGRVASHEYGYCTGSHIEWKTCPGSTKEFKGHE
jgi:hypothetical protein